MNSLKSLQALTQVVNHDICPQMKRLIAENKMLRESNKNNNKYIKNLEKQNCELDLWREQFQDEGNFLCSNCEYIHNENHTNQHSFHGRVLCEECWEDIRTEYDD
tara:strand:- start:616 stop:930 length:315 start_codon:yes stop_codon:yes gene_type:complete